MELLMGNLIKAQIHSLRIQTESTYFRKQTGAN